MSRMVINKEYEILEAKKKTVIRALIRLPADSDDIASHRGDFGL